MQATACRPPQATAACAGTHLQLELLALVLAGLQLVDAGSVLEQIFLLLLLHRRDSVVLVMQSLHSLQMTVIE